MGQPVYIQDVTGDAYKALPVRRIDDLTEAARVGARAVSVIDPAVKGPYYGQPVRLVSDVDALPVWVDDGSTLGTAWAPTAIADWNASSLSDGAITGNWTDSVGGLTVAQGTGANQPVKAATSFNSAYPGVTFDGVNDHLITTTLTGLSTGATAGGIWILAVAVTSGSPAVLVSIGDAAAASRHLRKSNADRPTVGDGTTTSSLSSALVTSAGVMGGWWSGTEMGGSWNGVDIPTVTIASLNTATARMRFGANSAASIGNIAAMTLNRVIFTALLSTADRARMQGYLAWSVGLQTSLPATHAYRYTRP